MAHDAAQGTLQVVHRIPGRLRVRVPPGVRAADLSDAVAALSGVTSVTWSPRTRGLLVLYDRERADALGGARAPAWARGAAGVVERALVRARSVSRLRAARPRGLSRALARR